MKAHLLKLFILLVLIFSLTTPARYVHASVPFTVNSTLDEVYVYQANDTCVSTPSG
jgi:hypothetical protein